MIFEHVGANRSGMSLEPLRAFYPIECFLCGKKIEWSECPRDACEDCERFLMEQGIFPVLIKP